MTENNDVSDVMPLRKVDYVDLFKKYATQTLEKKLIAEYIKNSLEISSESTVLDVGSAQGQLIRMIQPKTKNITMIDIIDQIVPDVRYIKTEFQTWTPDTQYDLVVGSHMWEAFMSTKYRLFESNPECDAAVLKMVDCTKVNGNTAFVWNTYNGFYGQFAKFVDETIFDSRVPYVGTSVLLPVQKNKTILLREGFFTSLLRAEDFSELADYSKMLFMIEDKSYEKNYTNIISYLQKNLVEPVLAIEQKIEIHKKLRE
ncbi:MAG: methyltransferase domain-containing protein [Candidatus Woesearchaeota archaeon]